MTCKYFLPLATLMLPLALAACGTADRDSASGSGITTGEAHALDDAAEMIEQRQLPAAAFDAPRPGPTTKTPAASTARPQ